MKRIIILFLLLLLSAESIYANSAQTNFYGSDGVNVIQLEESPIVVEKEVLTFDVVSFPKEHYKTLEEYETYDASVTAEYHFYNPSDLTIKATLLFPFGVKPDYGYKFESENYHLLVNDEEIPYRLRHSFKYYHDDFNLEEDLSKLHDGFMEDAFYDPDQLVTIYRYKTSRYDEANDVGIELKEPLINTRILLENQTTLQSKDGTIRISTWPDQDEIILYVIGEDQNFDWKFYSDGSLEDEVTGELELLSKDETNLKDFLLQNYDPSSEILDFDYYNAMIYQLNLAHHESGCILDFDLFFDLEHLLMRWYEYVIKLEPNERIVNEVVAPLYPKIDLDFEPPIYEYSYLLSPAKTFESFEALEIYILTDTYLTESNQDFEKYEDGYKASFNHLVDGDLNFTLCSEGNPKVIHYYGPNQIIPFVAVFIGMVLFGIIIKSFFRKIFNKNK